MLERTAGRSPVWLRARQAALFMAAVAFAACGTGPEGAGSAGGDGVRGSVLDPPIEKPDFVLTDTEGRDWDFRTETSGRLALLFFGYTYCPDVCPVTMANLGAVISKYPFEVRDQIRVVFVSTDPARDSPERIRSWLEAFGGDITGLRGDIDAVNRIQAEMGLPPAMLPDSVVTGVDYAVGHSARVLAFTPDNLGRVAYPFGTRQEDWIHDLPLLLKQRDW